MKSDDLISRSALLDAICENCSDYGRCRYPCINYDMIALAPTVDAEPVVRCKDCKHLMEFTKTYRRRFKFDGSCGLLAGYTDCDRDMRKYTDYCSNGEPKMDAEVSE